MGVYKILHKNLSRSANPPKVFEYVQGSVPSFKVNIKSKNAKSIFPCHPTASQAGLRRPKLKTDRKEKHPYSLTRSLLKTIHCFKSFPDAPYLKLLHFLATICHSFSQSLGFLLVLVSQTTTQCIRSEQVNFWDLWVGLSSVLLREILQQLLEIVC